VKWCSIKLNVWFSIINSLRYLTFSRNFATIVQYPKPSFRNASIWALSSYDILPITKVIGLTAIMSWNIEEFRVYYNAMLHVNIKIMTSQQRWYLLLSYFNDKINFLFSCEMRSSSLRFREFDICQVNTAQSNTLVHSIVPNKWPKFGAKILGHFWDITIFVLRYYILHHPVYNVTNSSVIVETASVTACVKARL